MHSFYLLTLLILTCVFYTNSAFSLETDQDDSPEIETPVIVPLNVKPQSRHRLGAQILRHLQRSSDTCPSDYNQCGNGLPSNFCCKEGDSCIALANDTTVVCCPNGGECDSIQPITCEMGGQNAAVYPTTSVHTTNLTGQLPECGTEWGKPLCCPFGYSCQGNTTCSRTDSSDSGGSGTLSVDTASAASIMTISSPAGSAATVVAAQTTSSISVASSTSSSTDSSSSGSSTKPRTIGIATGSAVAGVASICGLLTFAWIKRRQRKQRKQQPDEPSPQFPPIPPPLPPKEPQPLKKKRKSILSWVPSVVNRTPAELPATPVSFSAWNTQWGQAQRPNTAHRPYPRDSLSIEEIHELDARWLPQERHDIYR